MNSNKRAFSRLNVDASIAIFLSDGRHIIHGKTKDLSGGGLQFYSEVDVPVNEILQAEISTDEVDIAPLLTKIKIIRSEHIGEYYRISAEVVETQ